MQLRDSYPQFERLGVEIASISVSSPQQTLAYSQHTGLPFPLISDPERTVIKAYGVYHFLSLEAFRMARPSVFLIDRDQRVRFLYVGSNQFDRPEMEALLAEVAKLA